MGRLLAIFGGLIGVLLVPLALVSPTAWLLLPAHLAFTVLATVAALGSGVAGRPGRARAWGVGHLLASIAMVTALEIGSRAAGGSCYWIVPWLPAVMWGWIPSVAGGLSGWFGESVSRYRSSRAIRRRRRVMT